MDALQQWWDGLDDDEKAEAKEAQRSRRLTARMEGSLRKAGAVRKDHPKGGAMPSDVETFLKARH